MTKPKISIAMAVCNVERYLAESIRSILGQTFRDFEFIVVDFGSTDKTKSMVASYAAQDARIKLHEAPKCSLPEARNAGCFLAQGQYIAIADADDVSLPNRLLWQVEFMEKHPEVGLLGGGVEYINAQGDSVLTTLHPAANAEIQAALVTRSVLWQPTAMMRKEAFVRVGGYRAAFTVSHDYDLWLRIAEHFEIANLQEVVLKYRIHPAQVSLRKRTLQSLCKLAAQASAQARRAGKPDPLDSVSEITPEALKAMGVTTAQQRQNLVADCHDWICNVSQAGEDAVALETALEILRLDLASVEPGEIADLHYAVARLYWRQNKFARSLVALGRAIMVQPAVVERLWKPVLRRVGLA